MRKFINIFYLLLFTLTANLSFSALEPSDQVLDFAQSSLLIRRAFPHISVESLDTSLIQGLHSKLSKAEGVEKKWVLTMAQTIVKSHKDGRGLLRLLEALEEVPEDHYPLLSYAEQTNFLNYSDAQSSNPSPLEEVSTWIMRFTLSSPTKSLLDLTLDLNRALLGKSAIEKRNSFMVFAGVTVEDRSKLHTLSIAVRRIPKDSQELWLEFLRRPVEEKDQRRAFSGFKMVLDGISHYPEGVQKRFISALNSFPLEEISLFGKATQCCLKSVPAEIMEDFLQQILHHRKAKGFTNKDLQNLGGLVRLLQDNTLDFRANFNVILNQIPLEDIELFIDFIRREVCGIKNKCEFAQQLARIHPQDREAYMKFFREITRIEDGRDHYLYGDVKHRAFFLAKLTRIEPEERTEFLKFLRTHQLSLTSLKFLLKLSPENRRIFSGEYSFWTQKRLGLASSELFRKIRIFYENPLRYGSGSTCLQRIHSNFEAEERAGLPQDLYLFRFQWFWDHLEAEPLTNFWRDLRSANDHIRGDWHSRISTGFDRFLTSLPSPHHLQSFGEEASVLLQLVDLSHDKIEILRRIIAVYQDLSRYGPSHDYYQRVLTAFNRDRQNGLPVGSFFSRLIDLFENPDLRPFELSTQQPVTRVQTTRGEEVRVSASLGLGNIIMEGEALMTQRDAITATLIECLRLPAVQSNLPAGRDVSLIFNKAFDRISIILDTGIYRLEKEFIKGKSVENEVFRLMTAQRGLYRFRTLNPKFTYDPRLPGIHSLFGCVFNLLDSSLDPENFAMGWIQENKKSPKVVRAFPELSQLNNDFGLFLGSLGKSGLEQLKRTMTSMIKDVEVTVPFSTRSLVAAITKSYYGCAKDHFNNLTETLFMVMRGHVPPRKLFDQATRDNPACTDGCYVQTGLGFQGLAVMGSIMDRLDGLDVILCTEGEQ